MSTVTLLDREVGSRARIATGIGFNCFEFQVPYANRYVDVIWSEPEFESGGRASGSGIPLLFPFPGRIPGTEFCWEGKVYQLAAGDGQGNAIHGFVLNRRWQIVEQSDNRVVGMFHASRDDPDLINRWPADFCLTAEYVLQGSELALRLTAENPDTQPLPFGLGTHPYFRLPAGGDDADACQVQLPVSEEWELDAMLPTGQRVSLERAGQYQAGMPFSDMRLDNVFCGLIPENDRYAARIFDPGSGLSVIQQFDQSFRECVVYTPPHREAICIEPYTCLPGGFQLQSGGSDCGIRVLAPGEKLTASVTIRVESSLPDSKP